MEDSEFVAANSSATPDIELTDIEPRQNSPSDDIVTLYVSHKELEYFVHWDVLKPCLPLFAKDLEQRGRGPMKEVDLRNYWPRDVESFLSWVYTKTLPTLLQPPWGLESDVVILYCLACEMEARDLQNDIVDTLKNTMALNAIGPNPKHLNWLREEGLGESKLYKLFFRMCVRYKVNCKCDHETEFEWEEAYGTIKDHRLWTELIQGMTECIRDDGWGHVWDDLPCYYHEHELGTCSETS